MKLSRLLSSVLITVFAFLSIPAVNALADESEYKTCGTFYIQNVLSGNYLGYKLYDAGGPLAYAVQRSYREAWDITWNPDTNSANIHLSEDDRNERVLKWCIDGNFDAIPQATEDGQWSLLFLGGNNVAFYTYDKILCAKDMATDAGSIEGLDNNGKWPLPINAVWKLIPTNYSSGQITFPPSDITQTIITLTIGQLPYTKNGVRADLDVAPYIDAGSARTMVPIRFIAEAMGAKVVWDDSVKTDYITLNGKTISIVLNKPLPGGMGTAVIKNDRLFVPVRYVSEQLGASVNWEDTENMVVIKK